MTRGFIAADALGLRKTYALKDMAQAHRDLESTKTTVDRLPGPEAGLYQRAPALAARIIGLQTGEDDAQDGPARTLFLFVCCDGVAAAVVSERQGKRRDRVSVAFLRFEADPLFGRTRRWVFLHHAAIRQIYRELINASPKGRASQR